MNNQQMIIIIDDNAEDRATLRRLLTRDQAHPYTILEAMTGQQGLDLCEANPGTDCLILDYRLPDLAGTEVLVRLRQNKTNTLELPVVMVSGYGNEEIAAQTFKLGGQDYLSKDRLTANVLHIAIQNAIELKRVERSLRDKLMETQAIIDTAAAAICVRALDGYLLQVNTTCAALYGATTEQVIGKKSEDFFDQTVVEAWRANDQAVVLADKPMQFEETFPQVAGLRTFISAKVPLYNRDGLAYAVCGISTDITEQKRAEANLRFLAEATRVLALSLDDETALTELAYLTVPYLADWYIVELLKDDRSVWPLTVYHRDPRQVAFMRVWLIGHPVRSEAINGAAHVIRTGEPELMPDLLENDSPQAISASDFFGSMSRLRLVSAMILPLTARGRTFGAITFIRAESGRHYDAQSLVFAQEIARRAEMAVDNAWLYRDARQAVLTRDNFLSLAAHELQTPITSLTGFAQLLLRQLNKAGTLDVERTKVALSTIERQAERLGTLISQLLDISRIESGRLTLTLDFVDIVQIVNDVVAGARDTTTRHPIEVYTEASVELWIDAARIEQVISNLVNNAIKYSPAGGSIIIEVTTPDAQTVRISVTDHGLGIPLEHRDRIFERFYQAHSAQRIDGLGLGLYISRQIVDLHKGQLEVTFPPDGGSCFTLTLPRFTEIT